MEEVWRAVIDWQELYEVSDRGRVRSLDRTYVDRWGNVRRVVGTILSPIEIDGYPSVGLSGAGRRRTTRPVHRLVLEAFRGLRPTGMQARHLNGIRNDSRLDNLQWSTPRVNIHDKQAHGTQSRGSAIHCSKLTPEQVLRVIEKAKLGQPRKAIAAEFGVDAETVRHICRGDKWKHLNVDRPGNRKSRPKLTDDEVREVRHRLAAGETEQVLSRAFRLPWKSVNLIRRGLTYAGVK